MWADRLGVSQVAQRHLVEGDMRRVEQTADVFGEKGEGIIATDTFGATNISKIQRQV